MRNYIIRYQSASNPQRHTQKVEIEREGLVNDKKVHFLMFCIESRSTISFIPIHRRTSTYVDILVNAIFLNFSVNLEATTTLLDRRDDLLTDQMACFSAHTDPWTDSLSETKVCASHDRCWFVPLSVEKELLCDRSSSDGDDPWRVGGRPVIRTLSVTHMELDYEQGSRKNESGTRPILKTEHVETTRGPYFSSWSKEESSSVAYHGAERDRTHFRHCEFICQPSIGHVKNSFSPHDPSWAAPLSVGNEFLCELSSAHGDNSCGLEGRHVKRTSSVRHSEADDGQGIRDNELATGPAVKRRVVETGDRSPFPSWSQEESSSVVTNCAVRYHLQCQHGGCSFRPSSGYEGDRKGTYCSRHHVDSKKNKHGCQHAGCSRRPNFGHESDMRSVYCFGHKLDGMVDVRSPRCKHPGCLRRPNFGCQGDKRGKYCFGHKLEGMVNVIKGTCQQAGCIRQPSFGDERERKPLYCSGHKLDGMLDVRSSLCKHPGCLVRSSFGYEGGRKTKYCAEHKLEGMVSTNKVTCHHAGCLHRPSFGYERGKKSTYCSRHKLDGMVDVRGSSCTYPGCLSKPLFGHKGDRKKYCSKHKMDGMVK